MRQAKVRRKAAQGAPGMTRHSVRQSLVHVLQERERDAEHTVRGTEDTLVTGAESPKRVQGNWSCENRGESVQEESVRRVAARHVLLSLEGLANSKTLDKAARASCACVQPDNAL